MSTQKSDLTKQLSGLSESARRDLFAFVVSSTDRKRVQDEGEYMKNALELARATLSGARN